MQAPVFSYIMAPLIYSLIKILCDQTELYRNADARPDKFRAQYFDTEDTFDFIVVGAGSSGAVVANRLAKHFKTLILESGGEEMPAQFIPSTSLLLLSKPELDWMHLTVPQTHACLASVNRQSLWSAGKGLGGTSLLNFLQYLRGHEKDYEMMANITSDTSWNYDNLIPHFQAFEDFRGEFGSQDIHGHGGELTVQPPPFVGMAEYFIKAGEEKGYPRVDLNGRYDEGFSVIYNNIRNGRRLSSNTAFLQPMRDNPNLTIYKFSDVTKILMRGEDNQAYAVEYVRHGMKKIAYASKEVIVSAGLVNSPKLLMLSGLGPKEHLESLGIEVKYDQPAVGKNVQDHISVFLGPFVVDKPVTMLLDRDVNSEAMTEFIDYGTGPLTSSGTMATSSVSSSFAKLAGEGNWPDLQLILLGTAIYSRFDADFAKAFHVRPDVLKKYFRKDKGKDSFQIIVSLSRPVQRGEIQLMSKNPKDGPIIDPKYLQNDKDVDVLVEGIKIAINLVENTTVFQSIGARLTDSRFPGCENVEFRSDDYWKCYIRAYSVSMHHLTGSCSMGQPDSKQAVVDSKLRVIGAKNLRVIDASVFPIVPSGNTNAPAMLVGQKGSSEIIKAWKNSEDGESINEL